MTEKYTQWVTLDRTLLGRGFRHCSGDCQNHYVRRDDEHYMTHAFICTIKPGDYSVQYIGERQG